MSSGQFAERLCRVQFLSELIHVRYILRLDYRHISRVRWQQDCSVAPQEAFRLLQICLMERMHMA
jgi:hypothetical protein